MSQELKMSITTLTEKNYNTVISGNGIVLVDCWAEWCGACHSFNPIYEKIAKKYSKHIFAKLNTVTEKQLVSGLGIEHIPTLMIFRDGILLFQQPGYYEEENLEDIIKQAESLDMDEVRAHIAAEKNEKEMTKDDNT
jgi:thioredoxin 1